MLGQWLFVRLRAAERALDEGRIDEAYACAVQPDIRGHRGGRKLIEKLQRPLMARARLHLQAGRYQDALNDLDKLELLGCSSSEIDELRDRARNLLRQHRADAGERRAAVEKAEQNLRAGRLDTGRLHIEKIDDPRQRGKLREELDIRLQRSDELLGEAAEALKRGDVLNAAQVWQDAVQRHGRTRQSEAFGDTLSPKLRDAIAAWLHEGRIERLLAARPAVDALHNVEGDLAEAQRIIAFVSRAVRQLGARDYRGLRESLLRLRGTQRKLPWVDDALAAVQRLEDASAILLASPLGLFASHAESAPTVAAGSEDAPQAAASDSAPPDDDAAALGCQALLMLVDGVGSALVLAGDRLRIGRVGNRDVDIPVPAEIQSHHADLLRDGEDYFLVAHGPVEVNHRVVRRTLLRDGDRIRLGSNAKLEFRRPSRKSATAVLRVSHRCRLPQDVSEVVLFRDTCLIGPQPNCHLRLRDGDSQIVVFDRGGVLHARLATSAGGRMGDVKALRLHETGQFGDIRVTVMPYDQGPYSPRA